MRVLSITRDRIPDEDAIEREQWLRYDSNEILFACAEQTKNKRAIRAGTILSRKPYLCV